MKPTIEELIDLWSRVIGNAPPRTQFEFWAIENTLEVMRESILVAAKKNLKLGGTMLPESCVRFATGVMKTRTTRNAENAANRTALAAEMEVAQ